MAKKRANGEGNIRKRKDGRWEGRYTAGYDEKTGKRITKSVLGKTQAEVKEKLARAITEAETLDTRRSDEYTLGTWLQTWYELYAKPHLRFSTAEYYRRGIELHITPRIGDIPLKKLTGSDLQWLYKGLQEHRQLCKGRRRVRISLQIGNGRCADEGNALCLKARDIVFGNVPVRDDPVHAVRRRDLDQRIVPEF